MRKIFVALLLLTGFWGFGQSVGRLRYDTVVIEKVGGSAELVLRNSTKDTIGFLYNFGNGRTGFKSIPASSGTGITDGNKGDVSVSGTGSVWTVNNSAITLAKIQNISSGNVLGRISSGSGVVEQIKAAIIDTSARHDSSILYWDSADRVYKHTPFIKSSTGSASPTRFLWKVGDAGTVSAGDSVYTNINIAHKYFDFYREGEKQFLNDTINGYQIDTLNGKLKAHPPFFAGEKVDLVIYDTWPTFLAPIIPTWVDLTFTTSDNGWFHNSGSTTWISIAGTGQAFKAHGVDNIILTAGGKYAAQYAATDGINSIIGFNDNSVDEDYTHYEYGVYINTSGAIWKDINGTISSAGVSLSVGDWVALDRTGNTFTIQTSPDKVTWTTIYTFSTTSSATFYIQGNAYETGKMYHPQFLAE